MRLYHHADRERCRRNEADGQLPRHADGTGSTSGAVDDPHERDGSGVRVNLEPRTMAYEKPLGLQTRSLCQPALREAKMLSTDKRTRAVGPTALVGLCGVVVAFMVLSLLVTATGTSRFAVAMGYDGNVGYAVGALLDLAKGILPIAVLALWSRRSLGLAAVFGMAWCSLVTFSWLATHATVSTAIADIERSGTWKMEVRSNTKAELASLERQLAALSRPSPPRQGRARGGGSGACTTQHLAR